MYTYIYIHVYVYIYMYIGVAVSTARALRVARASRRLRLGCQRLHLTLHAVERDLHLLPTKGPSSVIQCTVLEPFVASEPCGLGAICAFSWWAFVAQN